MKFGVREITDITFKATHSGQELGSLVATSQYDPMIFFDSAKTSTVESAVATVYAQGGRGNPRLLAWDGDKTVTFTFEDALMSPQSFAALSGADLIEANKVAIHLTEKAVVSSGTAKSVSGITISSGTATVSATAHGFVVGQVVLISGATPATGTLNGNQIILTVANADTFTFATTATGTVNGTITAAPPKVTISNLLGSFLTEDNTNLATSTYVKVLQLDKAGVITNVASTGTNGITGISSTISSGKYNSDGSLSITTLVGPATGDEVLVDFYIAQTGKNMTIEAGKFGGYYYVEANTLFRGLDGSDYPAQFTIPRAKVQSNFTFTMASTGDPSTFTFTMDAFPAKTRFGSKPVLFSLDISDTDSDVI